MKYIKLLVIVGLFIVFSLLFVYKDQKVAVLGYHSFSKDKETDMFIMPINEFEEQLKYLKKHHYKTLSLDEFYDYYKGKKKIPRKSVLITMDDGYQSNYDLAFPLLKKYGMKATVFYIGSNETGENKNYMNKETLDLIKKNYPNIEIASHSYGLHYDKSIEKGIDYLTADFDKMGDVVNTKYFAYPYGHYNEDIIKVLKTKKYKMAFGFGPGKEHRKASRSDNIYIIPRLNITNGMPLWKFSLRLSLPY